MGTRRTTVFPSRTRFLALCHLALLSFVSPLPAQPTPAAPPAPPSLRPPTREEGPREPLRLEPRRVGAGNTPASEPEEADSLRPESGELVREGAYLRGRRGRMVAGEGGAWVYLFDADAEGRSEPPMILQPSIRLMEMRRLAESRKETITFSVSGQVFVYHRRNYLLPASFTTVASESLHPAPPAPPGAGPKSEPGAHEQADPRAVDLLNEINQREGARTEGPRPAGVGELGGGVGGGGGSGGGNALREGLTLVRVRGRIERAGGTPGGSWLFVSDTGAGNEGIQDASLRLLPCLLLEEMERAVREGGERQPIVVSGQVFTYDDRAYLLPTVYQIERDREGNLVPAQ